MRFENQSKNKIWIRKKNELEEYTEKCCCSFQRQVQTIPENNINWKNYKKMLLSSNFRSRTLGSKLRKQHELEEFRKMLFFDPTSGPDNTGSPKKTT